MDLNASFLDLALDETQDETMVVDEQSEAEEVSSEEDDTIVQVEPPNRYALALRGDVDDLQERLRTIELYIKKVLTGQKTIPFPDRPLIPISTIKAATEKDRMKMKHICDGTGLSYKTVKLAFDTGVANTKKAWPRFTIFYRMFFAQVDCWPATASIPASGGESLHHLINDSNTEMAFRVVVPELVRVRPVRGVMAVGETVLLTVKRITGPAGEGLQECDGGHRPKCPENRRFRVISQLSRPTRHSPNSSRTT